MKYLLIAVLITSCALPSFRRGIERKLKAEADNIIQKGNINKKDNSLKSTMNRLGSVLNIIAVLSLVATIVFMAMKNTHFAGISGAVCIGSLFLIYSLSWLYMIIASAFWLSVFYGVVKIAMILKERNESRENEQELATHFHDPEGEGKLSENAQQSVLLHRHRGDCHPWKDKDQV